MYLLTLVSTKREDAIATVSIRLAIG